MKSDILHHLRNEAARNSLTLAQLGIDHDGESLASTPAPFGYEIIVEFDGATYDRFLIGPTLYENTVADWIAEQNRQLAAEGFTESQGDIVWSVAVYPAVRQDGDSPTYVLRSDAHAVMAPPVLSKAG